MAREREIILASLAVRRAVWEILALSVLLICVNRPAAAADAVTSMAADAHPQFEVVTVKPSPPGLDRYGFHSDGRRVWCYNQPVLSMIQFAYSVSEKQIVGAPEWLGNQTYDADGYPDHPGKPNMKQMLEMYQKLLADRFQLRFHHEKRELAVYAITVAKVGAKLSKSQGDPNGSPDQTGYGDNTGLFMTFTNTSMEELAASLQTLMHGKPVIDQTGLAGRYDFTLKWAREDAATSNPNALPSIFTAIEEQLGLKLEPVKAPVDVLVVDHVERPSAN
jgi:uncharacterized protein (TIGR03435 family)